MLFVHRLSRLSRAAGAVAATLLSGATAFAAASYYCSGYASCGIHLSPACSNPVQAQGLSYWICCDNDDGCGFLWQYPTDWTGSVMRAKESGTLTKCYDYSTAGYSSDGSCCYC
jgi:hypothetical protein